jgi:hypothetical protein
MDFLYVGIGVVFFLLSWGLIRVCDRLGSGDSGEER